MMKSSALCKAMLAGASALVLGAAMASSALAADVTPDRLANADKEPHNWLMNHRTYGCTAIFTA